MSSLRSPYHQVRERVCVQWLPSRIWLPRRQQQEKWWSLQSKPIYLCDVAEEQRGSVMCYCVNVWGKITSHYSQVSKYTRRCVHLNSDNPYVQRCSMDDNVIRFDYTSPPLVTIREQPYPRSYWPMSTPILTPHWLAPPITFHQWDSLYPCEWSS